MTVTIKYVGDEDLYSGWDGDQMVNLTSGEEATVSDAKAAQLSEDRPFDFEIAGKAAPKRPTPTQAKPPKDDGEPATTLDELLKSNRNQLNDRAAKLGVTAPEAMADKRSVANAILAAIEDQSAE